MYYIPLVSSQTSHGLRFYTRSTTKKVDVPTDDEFLDQEQRDKLFRGIFPADFSGEVITIRTNLSIGNS